MSNRDRLKEAKHGPVRQRHEEMKAMHSLNMVTGFDLMADFIDSLFEKHAKLIEEAHSRITAADNSLDGRLEGLNKRIEALDRRTLSFDKTYTDWWNDLSKQISDLADRLSVVHVQAQGDAKIKLRKVERTPIIVEDNETQQADPCSDDGERRLYHIVVDSEGHWRKTRVALRRGDQIILAYPSRPGVMLRDNDIIGFEDLSLGGVVISWEGTAGTAWDMHIKAKESEKRTSVIDDCLKQGEKRIRLDEIDRINRYIRSIYSSLHVSSYVREVVNTFDGYVEQRRREIEEGT